MLNTNNKHRPTICMSAIRWQTRLTLLSLAFLLTGCSVITNLGKTPIDMVADRYIDQQQVLLGDLMEKLYKRNPDQLRKQPGATMASRHAQVFEQYSNRLSFAELQRREEIKAMDLAFDPAFQGDRVFALMVGLTGMIRSTYGYRDEMFMLDRLDATRLARSARNIEILAWKLQHHLQTNGQPFLITSSNAEGVLDNTSFDRLYGKLIANQDMMAKILGDETTRGFNSVVYSTASMLFIPL